MSAPTHLWKNARTMEAGTKNENTNLPRTFTCERDAVVVSFLGRKTGQSKQRMAYARTYHAVEKTTVGPKAIIH